MDTRREFLKKAIMLSGATGIATVVPPSIQRALAINPAEGSTFLDAEHVVILMQENRSFDHCFGTLRGVRGFNDPRAVQLPNKNLVWLQSNQVGDTYAPFRFDIRDTKITWMGDVPHNRHSQVDAFNDGRYDQWLDSKRSGNKKYADMPLTLGHYTREDLPFNYAMADAFTICDQHFCSGMTSTWPNRLYLWGGTIKQEKSIDSKAFIRNSIPYGEATWKTFPERLEEYDISWKVYQNEISTEGGFKGQEASWLSNFGCNPLEFQAQYNARFTPGYMTRLRAREKTLTSEIVQMQGQIGQEEKDSKTYQKLATDIAKKQEVLAETQEEIVKWDPANFDKLSSYQKALYEKAFTRNNGDPDYRSLSSLKYEDHGEEREVAIPKGDVLYQFRKDVNSGNLPTVSWLVPSQNLSDHPSAPWYGTWFTSEILDILTRNPEVWKKTIFILTYDENDGYFDHVPPFVAPDPFDPKTGICSKGVNETGVEYVRRKNELEEGIPPRQARGGPIGLGFRVPMIIASPWSRGGKVCSQVFDHTSSLQFLETFINQKFNKNIQQSTISAWRRTVCGNLTAAFTRYESGKEKIDFIERNPFVEKIYNARFREEPNNFRKLSDEEMTLINKDPRASKLLPKQEPGMRVAVPLPYELYADGGLSKGKKSVRVRMEAGHTLFGAASAGSPFNVYAANRYDGPIASDNEGAEPRMVWHFAVSPGDRLEYEWPLQAFENNRYHLRVYGPNGFFRELAGDAADPDLQIACVYQKSMLSPSAATGNIELEITNNTGLPVKIRIADNAYKTKDIVKVIPANGRERIATDLKKSFGWYDFNVEVKGKDQFTRRYAGRVETGKASYTDPVMG